MFETNEIERFLEATGELTPNASHIWTVKAEKVAIGVVLLATWQGEIVTIRKQRVDGYEFSGKLALPGGVVRGTANKRFTQALYNTLLARAQDEAGFSLSGLSDITAMPARQAPVTRYTANGAERFSPVFGFRARIVRPATLKAERKSVQDAFFAKLPLDWTQYAPANRLILATALADQLQPSERQANAGSVAEALAFCNAAAVEVGLPTITDPWRV